MRGLDFRIPDDIDTAPSDRSDKKQVPKTADAPEKPPAHAMKKKKKAKDDGSGKYSSNASMGAESTLRTGGLEMSVEEGIAKEGAPELGEGTVVTAETEPGEGEPVCGYGVEVVELLEMEPIDESTRRPRRKIPWNKYASAAFMTAFVLGIANAAVSLMYSSGVVSPAEMFQNPTCELAGEVTDISGHPLVNATVVVTDATRSAFTNRDGWYVLKGLSPGSHRVEAAAEGYNTMSIRTDLQPNLLNMVDFTLEKGGRDVVLDEKMAPDFGQASSSYRWAVPMLVFFSVCALAAAILSFRQNGSRLVLVILGCLGILSFGFVAGSILAIAGIIFSTLSVPEGVPLPRKKLRVGVSYPSKEPLVPRPVRRARPLSGTQTRSYGEYDRAAAVEGGARSRAAAVRRTAPPQKAAPSVLRPVPPVEGAPADIPPLPRPDGAAPELEPVPPAEGARAEIGAARPTMLKDRSAEGELDGPAAPEKAPTPGGAGPFTGPKRLIRRRARRTLLCYLCVEEIGLGAEYIKCSCGRTLHVHCLKEPRCPCCGTGLGRNAAK